MGSFFKNCSCSKPTKCAHLYTIRFRDGAGKQREETGYPNQDAAKDRLTALYDAKRKTPVSVAETRSRLRRMTFEEYSEEWRGRQREILEYSTGAGHKSHLRVHLYPELGSRKLETFDSMVLERFIATMERNGVKLGTQRNVYGTLHAILLDAFRKGGIPEDPTLGVQPPKYVPDRAVVPDQDYIRLAMRKADFQLAILVTMMYGCGLRNGEARAVNINNIVADDVYRVTEQIHHDTYTPAPLKHRKEGEFREVPLPWSVKLAIERFVDEYGMSDDGYLLRGPRGYFTFRMESNRAGMLFKQAPPPEGMTLYGFRHFFASNCLSRGIPITDVAEWMGHRNIQVTYRTYRHLMPGSISKAAKVLEQGLAA
ncbi:tyrosine-type recombinase/integrase [Streptomyces bathyalis]|uniref:Tyrosine-type recombinase/integrase n=2 Tax=Streptomyces bathyalis TaxID=2710756 RepID=A0A7T1WTI9_9ACTN|nr:tyrosine-type recombinase/integrase [Streptomyces bathyalis]